MRLQGEKETLFEVFAYTSQYKMGSVSYRCPKLTQDVPRVEETGHTQKDIFILAEWRVENAKMAEVNTTPMGAIDV